MFQPNKHFHLGSKTYTPNTFIGGVAATLGTPDLIATKLSIARNRVKAFNVVGSDIEFCVIGGSYGIPDSAFTSNSSLTYYNDQNGLCTTIGKYSFRYCTLQSVNFPALITIGLHGFGGVTFLSDVTLPSWNNVGSNQHCFYGAKFTNFYAPAMVNLNTVGNSSVFYGCEVTGEMVMENLATIGNSVSTNSNTFSNMIGGGSLKVPQALMTVNSGTPEPDLLGAGNIITVDYIGYVSDNSYDIEIGGVGTSINTRNLIASKFGLNTAGIENVQIIGSDIRFKVLTSTCQVASSTFSGNLLITHFKDYSNKCTVFGYRAFRMAGNLVEILADGVTQFVDECFLGTKLVDVSFPALTTINGIYGAFGLVPTLKSVNFPNLTTVTISKPLFDNNNLESINIQSLSILFPNGEADKYLIQAAKTGVAITVPIAAQTSNGGTIDPDLQYAISTFGAVVTYV